MNVLMRHIEWLLTTHDCVVIPRMGAVLAHYKPAEISDDGRYFIPPCRVFTFNSELKVTDGLVESSVARSMGISHDRASAIVAADVDTMIHQLHNDSHLSLGRIGTLQLDHDSETIEFRPFRNDGITHLASWLPETTLSYFDSERKQDAPASTDLTKSRTVSPVHRFVKATAAAAAIVAIAFITSTPIAVRDAHLASTSLPTVTAPRPAYVPSMITPVITMPRLEEQPAVDTAARAKYQQQHHEANAEPDAAKIPDATKIAQPVSVPSVSTQSTEIRFNETDPYCVVVGSLNSEQEAQDHIARLGRNFPHQLGVLVKDGRYRVYAATGATKAQANAAARSLSDRFAGAWVCSK